MSFITDMFGGSEDTRVNANPVQPRISNLNTAGFNLTNDGSAINVGRTGDLQKTVDALGTTRLGANTGLADIAGLVGPGFEGLRASRLRAAKDNSRAAIGNLKSNLNKRSVLGSSFAGDALVRAGLEGQKEEDRIIAESKLQEIGVKTQLIQQASDISLKTIQAELDQFNKEANIGQQASAQELQAATANAALAADAEQFNAKIAQEEAAGMGAFLGTVAGAGIGFMVGQPALGAQIGNAAGGGGSSIQQPK